MSTGPTASGTGRAESTAETAKEQARDVAHEGIQGGRHVAEVAGEQAKGVAAEAGHQARSLFADARSELLDHAASQQKRVADQLHELSHELGSMASRSEKDGLATDLAQQASRQIGTVAHWVSEREPGSMVGELKGFARNRPGAFLAVAAGIGLFAGRMTRGVKAGAPAQDSGQGVSTTSERAIPDTTTREPEPAPAPARAATPRQVTRDDPPDSGVGFYSGDAELTGPPVARTTGTTR
jgi:hypothetical protein